VEIVLTIRKTFCRDLIRIRTDIPCGSFIFALHSFLLPILAVRGTDAVHHVTGALSTALRAGACHCIVWWNGDRRGVVNFPRLSWWPVSRCTGVQY